jgi:hypothetical protein
VRAFSRHLLSNSTGLRWPIVEWRLEDRRASLVACSEPPAVNELALERREEALDGGVLIRGAHRPHRSDDPGLAEFAAEREARELVPWSE